MHHFNKEKNEFISLLPENDTQVEQRYDYAMYRCRQMEDVSIAVAKKSGDHECQFCKKMQLLKAMA